MYTGNLDIIGDRESREALVELHAHYSNYAESFEVNGDWVLGVEDTVYLNFDALRFDSRTAELFPEQSIAVTAQHVRENLDLLTRHAALHFWLKDRAVEILADALAKSQSVLDRIDGTQ